MLIEYHRNLLSDKVRNDAFAAALEKVIKKGESVVADIGSGTGLMGFLASRLGAKQVYMYEYGDVMDLSKKLAKDNGIKNCQFIREHSTEAENPPLVDIIVSETMGNYALEEHIISTIEDAKRFLKPGGAIIPRRIRHFVCPVLSDRFFRELCVWDNVGHGLDYSAAKEMSLNNIYVRTFAASDLLDAGSAAQAWDDVDFHQKNSSSRKGSAEWSCTRAQTIYGFAVWWECELVPGIALSTGPLSPKTHWEQLYFPVREPLEAERGDRLVINLASRSSHQEGTIIDWQMTLLSPSGKRKAHQALSLAEGYLG